MSSHSNGFTAKHLIHLLWVTALTLAGDPVVSLPE